MSEARLDAIILAVLKEEDAPKNGAPTDEEVFAGIDADLPLDAIPVSEFDHLNWVIQRELELETFTP